jgi:lipopolysaccharide export system protein LptA
MFARLTRIVASFAAVIVAYWTYALIAVPVIEPPAQARKRIELTKKEHEMATNAGDRHKKLFAQYFQPGDWELEGNPKVLESSQAKLLIQEYHNLPDGRVKLQPCTIIFFPNAGRKQADGEEQVIIMKAPEGALLQFDEPFDLRRAKVGKLVGGQLVGKITIRSAPARPGSPDDLYISTRDVELLDDRAWTPHPVEFRMGKNQGSGREMRINLVKTDDSGSKRSGPQFGEVESFELARDVKLRVQMEPGAGQSGGNRAWFGGQSGTTPAGAAAEEPPVEVTCQGPFKFDVPRALATFTDQVDVLRLNAVGPSDQMNCELLAIQFGPRERKAAPVKPREPAASGRKTRGPDRGEGSSPPKSSSFDLEPRRIEAVGDPVVIRAPSQGGHARCQRLEYEIKTRRIVLEGSQDVMLHQGSNEIRARRFDYRPGEGNRLGWLSASGPGSLQGAMEEHPNQKYQAHWKTELRMRPQDQTQVVSLVGEAQVRYSEMGALSAEEIHLWMVETPKVQRLPATAEVVTTNYSPGSIKPPADSVKPQSLPIGNQKPPAMQLLLDRMMAQGDVAIDSPQLTGGTKRLEIWFQQSSSESASSSSGLPNRTAASAQTGRNSFNRRTPTQTFDVRGDLVRLQLLMQEKLTRIADVSVEGMARFVETKTAKPDEKPLVVQGDRLQVAQADSEEAQVSVTGKPAMVEARGLSLLGGKIQMDQSTNRLWIDGPGRMRLPMDRDLSGRALGEQQNMEIDWQGGMQFDGRTIVYDRAVTARGEHQSLKAESVEVTLREKVDFANPQARAADHKSSPAATAAGQPTDSSQIEQVVCRGGVTIQNRTFDGEGQVSSDQMQMRDISINQVTGLIDGRGPGWITTVRRGAPRAPAFGGGPLTPLAPVANETPGQPKFSYLNVRFEGKIGGNVHRQELTFADQVRAVYGPVDDWQSQLDPDAPEQLGPQAVLLTSDQLTVRQMPSVVRGQQATTELETLGNTRIEGQTFTAQAHKLTFAEAKDLLVLEGDGSSDARLFRQERPGAAASQAAARRIMYWPSTRRVEVDDARFLDIGSLGGGKPSTAQKDSFGIDRILGPRVPTAPRSTRSQQGNGTAIPRLKK